MSDNPYRKSEQLINRLLWQDSVNEVRYRTMADSFVEHGREISAHIEGKAQDILSDNHFDPITARPDLSHCPEMAMVLPKIDVIPADKVGIVIAQYNAKRERDRQINESLKSEVLEDPGKCVNISLDDVLVTQQKEGGSSKDSLPKESKQYVKDTVIHVQQGLAKYISSRCRQLPSLPLATSRAVACPRPFFFARPNLLDLRGLSGFLWS